MTNDQIEENEKKGEDAVESHVEWRLVALFILLVVVAIFSVKACNHAGHP